jgi:hypothetical protein
MMWLAIVALLLAVPAATLWYVFVVPGRAHEGPLPPPTAEQRDIAQRLRTHVTAIASSPHNVAHYAALDRAAQYLERTLRELGYTVDSQVFTAGGRSVRNVEATREPRSGGAGAASFIIGAHYDSYEDSPGANDNGTGTAAVLEIARLLKDWQGENTRLRLVLFVNEEPPYYRTEAMGSWRYAKRLSEKGERVHGMISLETLGAFYDKPGSQAYPPPFGLIFPSTGNFIAFVAMPGSRGLLHEVLGAFRKNAAFPTIGGVAPDAVPGIGWSDHWSFKEFGYRAIMVTDTALYRYPHYHLPSDTPDKIDYGKLARITKGFELVVRDIVK